MGVPSNKEYIGYIVTEAIGHMCITLERNCVKHSSLNGFVSRIFSQ